MTRTMAVSLGVGLLVIGGIALLLLSEGPRLPPPRLEEPAPPVRAAVEPQALESSHAPPPAPSPAPPRPTAAPVFAADGSGTRLTKEAGTIAGRVLLCFQESRTPVAGAEIMFATKEGREPAFSRTVVTGADGAYRVTGLPAGFLRITMETSEEMWEYRGGTTLDEGMGLEDYILRVAAVGSLEGRVTGPRGEPIRGLRIGAEDIHDRRSFSASTDLDGTYRFARLPTGMYSVSTVSDLLGLRRGRILVNRGEKARMDFPGGASIVGTAIGADGAPLAGAVVHVDRWAVGAPPVLQCRGRVDANGAFRVECLEPGPCRVHVEVDGPGGFLSPEFPVDVRTGENRVPIDFSRGEMRGGVGGRVRVAGGSAPGPDARIQVGLVSNPPADGKAWGRSNVSPDGTFGVGGIPAGAYRLMVSSGSGEYRPWDREIVLGTGERKEGILVDLVRVPVGRVRFVATLESGAPVESPRVELSNGYFRVESQGKGSCTVTAQAGSRTFVLWAPGIRNASKVVEVKEGQDVDVEVVLEAVKPDR